jgi:Protein of unknown function (DUF2380)
VRPLSVMGAGQAGEQTVSVLRPSFFKEHHVRSASIPRKQTGEPFMRTLSALSAVVLVPFLIGAPQAGCRENTLPRLTVLNIELTGDLGGPKFTEEHRERIQKESAILREELARSGLYQVLDNDPARSVIDKLTSQHAHLYDCNGCDLDIGKQLGADEVMVVWIDRVSALILSLTYEIHDVRTERIVDRKSYDLRGDNDAAWTHAVQFMVRDMKERGGKPEPAG